MKKSRNLRRLEATEADTLKTITDFLDLQMAQGKLVYLRHSPSNVILSWNLIKDILHLLYNRMIGEGTAFQKIKSSCFRPLPENQKGAVDLIVFKQNQYRRLADWENKGIVTDVLLIEVKSPTGKLSSEQEKWAKKAVAQGCRYIVARSLEDVMENLG